MIVTVSPARNSPVTVPVMAMSWPASAAFNTLSAVTSSTVIVIAGAVVSTVYGLVEVAVPVLPAASVDETDASTVVSGSAARAEPGTLIENVPSAATVPV